MKFEKIRSCIIFLLLILLIVTVHEFGHLFAIRAVGLNANELNIGFGIPYLDMLSLNFNIGSITFHIKPIMLGGYVTTPEEFENMEFYKKFSVYIAGCMFNIVSGILVLTGLGVINKKTILESLKKSVRLLLSLITTENITERAFSNQYVKMLEEGSKIQLFFVIFSVMSFVLAIINLLPIYPLDGGRIVFDSMINEEELGVVLMISVINYYIISNRKKIITKIKSLTAL